MIWAKAALAGGLLVLLAAFAVGTEDQLSTQVTGRTYDCGPAISASWLVSGTPDHTTPPESSTNDEQRAAEACRPVVLKSRVLIGTLMGLGGLLAVAGLTAIRARDDAEGPTETRSRAESARR